MNPDIKTSPLIAKELFNRPGDFVILRGIDSSGSFRRLDNGDGTFSQAHAEFLAQAPEVFTQREELLAAIARILNVVRAGLNGGGDVYTALNVAKREAIDAIGKMEAGK